MQEGSATIAGIWMMLRSKGIGARADDRDEGAVRVYRVPLGPERTADDGCMTRDEITHRSKRAG